MKPLLFISLLCISSSWAQDVENNNCGINEKSKRLAALILSSKNQKRQQLSCDRNLALAAAQKAKTLSKADRVSHNVNNTTPNEFLSNLGIKLPYKYEVLGNQVEAISGGKENAQEAFDYFLTSQDHKAHILGENSFYQSQDKIGVGYYHDDNKNHEDYWVVYLTAFRKDDDVLVSPNKVKFRLVLTPEKKERFKRGSTLSRKKWKKQP